MWFSDCSKPQEIVACSSFQSENGGQPGISEDLPKSENYMRLLHVAFRL
ncbi:hypothetical protein [Companilactobacillus alimentarius]|nr:hypothetical protein [Companilactobacillus alimentarius]